MQPSKLSERTSKTSQEARKLQEVIDSFGPGFEEKYRLAVNRLAVENLEQAYQKVMKEVKKESDEIARFPILYPENEVWVYAYYSTQYNDYILSACKMKKESAHFVATKMRERGQINITLEAFKDVIHELRTSILEGKLDGKIHLKVEALIYEKICEKFQS